MARSSDLDIDITVGQPRTAWTADLSHTWTTARTVRTTWDTEDLEQTWTTGELR